MKITKSLTAIALCFFGSSAVAEEPIDFQTLSCPQSNQAYYISKEGEIFFTYNNKVLSVNETPLEQGYSVTEQTSEYGTLHFEGGNALKGLNKFVPMKCLMS